MRVLLWGGDAGCQAVLLEPWQLPDWTGKCQVTGHIVFIFFGHSTGHFVGHMGGKVIGHFDSFWVILLVTLVVALHWSWSSIFAGWFIWELPVWCSEEVFDGLQQYFSRKGCPLLSKPLFSKTGHQLYDKPQAPHLSQQIWGPDVLIWGWGDRSFKRLESAPVFQAVFEVFAEEVLLGGSNHAVCGVLHVEAQAHHTEHQNSSRIQNTSWQSFGPCWCSSHLFQQPL